MTGTWGCDDEAEKTAAEEDEDDDVKDVKEAAGGQEGEDKGMEEATDEDETTLPIEECKAKDVDGFADDGATEAMANETAEEGGIKAAEDDDKGDEATGGATETATGW